MLLQVNPIGVNGAAGEIQQGRFPGGYKLIDLLDSTRIRNTGAGADSSPKHSHQDVTSTHELVVNGFLGPHSRLRYSVCFPSHR